MPELYLSRRYSFASSHRLYSDRLTRCQNEAIFGKCANPNGHGHNYRLTVTVGGPIDPETGFVIDLKILKELIEREVEDHLDHKNLNIEVPEFKTLNPTVENIAIVIYNRLKPFLEEFELEVVLYETPRNYVTYTGA